MIPVPTEPLNTHAASKAPVFTITDDLPKFPESRGRTPQLSSKTRQVGKWQPAGMNMKAA